MSGHIQLRISVPSAELEQAYQQSNLYVQLSAEEGFCMTTLDAAMYGLPIVGTPAGAIPEIIEESRGILAEIRIDSLYEAIKHIHLLRHHYQPGFEQREKLMAHFSWENASKQLAKEYKV